MAAGRTGLRHLDLPVRPRANRLDREAGSLVGGPLCLEWCDTCSAHAAAHWASQVMVRVRERPTATDRDEARVTILREDHDRSVWQDRAKHSRPPQPLALAPGTRRSADRRVVGLLRGSSWAYDSDCLRTALRSRSDRVNGRMMWDGLRTRECRILSVSRPCRPLSLWAARTLPGVDASRPEY